MKNYNLKITGSKLKKIGRVFFTYDKAFFSSPHDSNPKYIPNRMAIDIFAGETPESVKLDVQNRYKNPRNFEIKMIGDQNGSI